MAIDDSESFIIGVNADMSKIRNTNGNWWEPTGANVQLAIDDLDEGTVTIGSKVTIDTPILLKSEVEVDFMKNFVTLSGDFNFVLVEKCNHATLKNVKVFPTPGHTASLIKLNIPTGGGWHDKLRYNTFENIYLRNTGTWTSGIGWTQNFADGIHIKMDGNSNTLMNTFKNIQMEGVKGGIHLEAGDGSAGGWSSGSLFENIWVDQFDSMIWFDRSPTADGDFNQNVFNHVKGQAATFSNYGVRDVYGSGNHFDHCLVWDWFIASGSYDWIIDTGALRTYINAHYIDSLLDKGTKTMIDCPTS